MRTLRFKEERTIAVLQELEAASATADVCRRYKIRLARFYKWKAKFGA